MSAHTSDANGKVALVTGGSSGIGRATALAFAGEGARVVVADIAAADGERTVAQIREHGGEAQFVRTDVSQSEEVAALIARTLSVYGRLDCAFNNAGTDGKVASTTACTEENWDRTLAVNLKSVWLCMKQELPHMLERGAGSIVNCASIAGLVAFPMMPAYAASKHGVVGLTRTAAIENARSGVRINAVCPGVIRTPMVERGTAGRADVLARLLAPQPIGRLGTAEEIASVVLFLCSEAASLITGQAIAVDGGWTAQ
jgi:NAD(P)-dependent dehydrogenase (short-subunit alcohol dehydrogenase family)